MIAQGDSALMQAFIFKPANLDGVSVLAIERLIEALRVEGVSRAQFGSGEIPNDVISRAEQRLMEYYGLDAGANSTAERELKSSLRLAARLARNPVWRGYYEEYYQNSLRGLLRQAMAEGIEPLSLARNKPVEVYDVNPETGRLDKWLRWEFKNPADPSKPIFADMHLPNDDLLMQYRPSELAKAGVQAARSLPGEAALFYIANNILSIGTQFINPTANPSGIENVMGMYFDKKTVLNFEELFNFYTFIYGSRVSTRAIEIALKRAGTSYATQLLARPFMNYIGLASGSLFSSFIADGWTSSKNCYLGYFDNPDNFKSSAEADLHRQNCDLAYERWIRGKMAFKYMGDAMTLVMAAGASAMAQKALGKTWQAAGNLAAKSRHAILKAVASRGGTIANRVVVSGMRVARVVGAGTSVVPTPPTQLVGWGVRVGHFVMFLFWHKMVNAVVAKPYKSWDLAGEVDDSEDRLMRGIHDLQQKGWVIEANRPVEKCGNLLQRLAGDAKSMQRLIERGEGLRCYDGTVLQLLDEYAADQKDWRDMHIEEVNASYSSWTKHTLNLVDKYAATHSFYQDFVSRVRTRSSLVFGDRNPYSGMNGVIASSDREEYISEDGKWTTEEMRRSQEANISLQAGSMLVWRAILQSPDAPRLLRQYLKPKQGENEGQLMAQLEVHRRAMVDQLGAIQQDLVSGDVAKVKQGLSKVWELDKHYRDHCVSQIEGSLTATSEALRTELNLDLEALKRTADRGTPQQRQQARDAIKKYTEQLVARSKQLQTPPFCYFSETRRRFGNFRPGGSEYSKVYLEEISALIASAKVDVNLFSKNVGDVSTPNVATHLLAAMACGLDLDKRPSWWRRVLPGFKADTSARGWSMVWGERPRSSVKDAFGFEMDFTPPRLIPVEVSESAICAAPPPVTDSEIPKTSEMDYYMTPYEPVDPYLMSVRYKNKDYVRLIELVAENLYPDLVNDQGQEGSGFEYWWSNYVGRDFNQVLDAADASYRRMLREKFLPAIYGHKEYLNTDLHLRDCSYTQAYRERSRGRLTGRGAPVRRQQILPHGEGHMYPPKYISREEIRKCGWERYKYNPVINSSRIEFEVYLNHVLKPIFMDMFAKDQRYQSRENMQKAEIIFNKNRNWVLTSLDMLLRYQEMSDGKIDDSHVATAESWLVLNLEALKIKMGLPADPQMAAVLRHLESQVDSYDPDLEAFPFRDWERRQEMLRQLIKIYPDLSVGSTELLAATEEIRAIGAPAWDNLNEDQRQLALAAFRKMLGITKELANYRRIVSDVRFR